MKLVDTLTVILWTGIVAFLLWALVTPISRW